MFLRPCTIEEAAEYIESRPHNKFNHEELVAMLVYYDEISEDSTGEPIRIDDTIGLERIWCSMSADNIRNSYHLEKDDDIECAMLDKFDIPVIYVNDNTYLVREY